MLRSKFLMQTGFTAASLSILASLTSQSQTKEEKVKLAFIGTGMSSQNHLDISFRRAH